MAKNRQPVKVERVPTACPHCSSENGYRYRVRCFIQYVGTWTGGDPDEDGEVGYYPSDAVPQTVECVECGGRSRRG